ncbi:MAG TPA: response regulator transcription factor [Candidatus Kapabacteria bacterium]|nr:response regulator transcription factor [Candidatus Kapabacteria bacterium]
MRKTSVLLVDDHPFVREGIRSFLSDLPDFEVVGEATSGTEALKLAEQYEPDFILLDINMPGMNGLEAVGQLRKSTPEAKILILTVHNSREYVLHVAKSGAHGYILKEAPPEELLQAMQAIRSGQKYYSPTVAGYVLDEYERGNGKKDRADKQLTPREVEVLIATAKGKSIKEMADELNITAATVQTYRVRIMEKLEIHNVAGLVKYALQKGYLPLD